MEECEMVNKDLYEVYIPAADRVMGAYRDFSEALNLTKTMFCEVHIRKNLQLECIVRAKSNPNLVAIKK